MTENPFDPNYKLPPLPVRDPLHELRRIEAAAALAETTCRHCVPKVEAIGHDGGMLRAVGITHQPGCPDYVEF
ncbi:hypothetical protein ACQCSX_08685 [Pseudarthrobacter sp. P1]|uniref:hypothetical protein n=1 Tax=Pseudarthrobacter sp. P1 TaxID=3418418 RepID=UPI003CF7CEDC